MCQPWLQKLQPPPKGKRFEFKDDATPGLYLRVSSSKKVWFSRVRVAGTSKVCRITLGVYPEINLAAARKKAWQIYSAARNGVDPAEEKKAKARAIEARLRELTVQELCHEFIEKYAKAVPLKPATIREYERQMRCYVIPAIGNLKITSVEWRDLRPILDAINDRGSTIMANRVRALLSKLFNFAAERGLIGASPAAGLPKYGKEVPRNRVLGEDEIRIFWQGTENHLSQRMSAILKLCLVTGQRLGEVTGMKWTEIDMKKALWTIPGERTKNANIQILPLSDLAMTIIQEINRTSDFVFPGGKGRPHVNSMGKAMTTLRRATGLDFRPHDLRRTAATNLAALGCPELILKHLLNHSQSGNVTAIYDQYRYEKEKRFWLDKWGRKLGRILGLETKVIRFPGDSGSLRRFAT